jgi:DNA helicase-2/ATP-dependent DNA helicase PcrA
MEETGARPPTAEEAAIHADEERLAASVREAVTAARALPRRGSRRAALAALQDDYAAAGEEDRPAVLAQMAQQAARDEALAPQDLPDLSAPYFAHMRLRSNGRCRDVLLGDRAFLDPGRGVAIVDWRRAPIAEVFFTCDPGDDYEIEVDGRIIEGVLERRHIVTFEGGALSCISMASGSLQRGSGPWRFTPEELVPSLSGAPIAPGPGDRSAGDRGAGGRGVSPTRMAGLLDAQQAALLERDPGQPLLVLGSAGCGKTTVALHRVASLCQRYPDRFPPERVLVIVPEAGLRHFAERLLADLAVEGVAVRTFDEWIRAEARRVFPWLPAREPPDPPFAVSRLKRHPAMLAAMDRLIDDLARAIGARLDHRFAAGGEITAALEARREPILAHRLRHVEKAFVESAAPARKHIIAEAFRDERRRLTKVRADHWRLVGDRELLAHAVRASGGELPMTFVDEVATHTNRQLDEPSEIRFAHVDADRLATLDGRSLDDGTPEAAAGTVDSEDYALLFELYRRKTGKSATRAGGRLSSYAHLVLDEAQELAPVELRALGRTVDPHGGSVTVAGDAAQRIDRTGYFASWESVMEALGARAAPAYLETSYRCARPIVEFAYAVLGPEAPETMPRAVREGAPVLRTGLPAVGHAAAALTHALRDLRAREPEAGVAIVAHDAKAARALHEVLARALPVRLVLDGDFAFGPGIEVTEVAQIKGLEFDYVVVPDADARTYPDTPEHRRRLHVAATRAAHRLWILSPGAPSPILPAGEGAGGPDRQPRDGGRAGIPPIAGLRGALPQGGVGQGTAKILPLRCG